MCKIRNSNDETIQIYGDKEGTLYFNWDDFSNCCVMTEERKSIMVNYDGETIKVIRHEQLKQAANRQIKAIRERERED